MSIIIFIYINQFNNQDVVSLKIQKTNHQAQSCVNTAWLCRLNNYNI